jgi:hypothetical protein
MRAHLRLFLLAALLLPACDTQGAPSESSGKSADSGLTRGNVAAESLKEYKTVTGKVIVISESHPVGQSLSTIEVSTRGFEHNRPETYEDRDPVVDVFTADLDGNGFDEIYIVTASQGSGSYGDVLAFASNRDKSLSMIHFPEAGDGDERFRGYMGHDAFTIEKNRLVRSFPVYNEGDTNSTPTGGRRRLVYGLHPGEAMWQLKIENSSFPFP